MFIGAVAILVILGTCAVAGLKVRRLNKSLSATDETLQIALRERKKLEVE